MTTTIPLTLLYAPADRSDLVAKALAGPADVVLVDLEDAVAASNKDTARDDMATSLSEVRERPVQVRINAPGSPWHAEDLDAVTRLPEGMGVRVPKCEDAATVAAIAERVAPRPTYLLVESALGIERCHQLACCHPGVAGIGLGEADLHADLGTFDDSGLAYARGRIVIAAAAAGLPPPAMSAYTDVADLDGLFASTMVGRSLGFLGRTAIHPRQLPVITRAFLPTEDEVRRAAEVVAALADAEEVGSGAVALPDGRFVDIALVRRAQRTLALAQRLPR